MFEIGKIYNRRADIHGPYKGQQYGGISTPANYPIILLFTGEVGEQYGYKDGWDGNGVFLYTGEGQKGDMRFDKGNLAIRDHAKDGEDLHLFEKLGNTRYCRYLGRFGCSTWEIRRGPDEDGNLRRVIIFHLISAEANEDSDEPTTTGSAMILGQLRQRALDSASEARERNPREARHLYHERSAAVREYVLARAGANCESCGNPAPFRRQDGTPYLEPHHTRRLSDGGPDHPRWVGAACPNCHREIHHGAEGEEKNRRLQQRLDALEEA